MHSASHGKTQRARRSAKDWEAVMAQYAASGLSQEAFCAREHIALGTFGSWRARIRAQSFAMPKGNQKTKKMAAAELPFLELVAGTQLASQPAFSTRDRREFDIELDLGRGIVLRMRT